VETGSPTKTMRKIKELAREPQISIRNLRKLDCAAKPVSTFADRALRAVDAKAAIRERYGVGGGGEGMRAALLVAVAVLGLAGSGPLTAEPSGASAFAQADPPRRVPPRVTITPRQPSADPYPSRGAAYPGPGYVRDCVAYYVEDPRPSGTVIVPRMRCAWVRGQS
jgi:hypothetical protein